MRANDFSVERLIEDSISNECEIEDNVRHIWPEMTYDDLTEDEKEYVEERVGFCDDCGYMDYSGNLTWLDSPRGKYCDNCCGVYDMEDIEPEDE